MHRGRYDRRHCGLYARFFAASDGSCHALHLGMVVLNSFHGGIMRNPGQSGYGCSRWKRIKEGNVRLAAKAGVGFRMRQQSK